MVSTKWLQFLLIAFTLFTVACSSEDGISNLEPRAGRPANVRPAGAEHDSIMFDPSASAGLFIGVQNFDRENIRPIKYSVDDAIDMAYKLIDLDLLDADGTVLMLSGEPNKAETRQKLEELKSAGATMIAPTFTNVIDTLSAQAANAGESGIFIAFVATHGFRSEGVDYLFAKDTTVSSPKETALSLQFLTDSLERSSTQRRLAILDACREYQDDSDSRSIDFYSAVSETHNSLLAQTRGSAVLSATNPGGYAYDGDGNGVFTSALLSGLNGEAEPDEHGFVTVETLANFADSYIHEWVKENKPHDSVTAGITSIIDGAAKGLPLAYMQYSQADQDSYLKRRDKALKLLNASSRSELDAASMKRIRDLFLSDLPSTMRFQVLDALESENWAAVRRASRLTRSKPSFLPPIIQAVELCEDGISIDSLVHSYYGALSHADLQPVLGAYRSVSATFPRSFPITGEINSAQDVELAKLTSVYFQGESGYLKLQHFSSPEGAAQIGPRSLNAKGYENYSWVFSKNDDDKRYKQLPHMIGDGMQYWSLSDLKPESEIFIVAYYPEDGAYDDGITEIWIEINDLAGNIANVTTFFGGNVKTLDLMDVYEFGETLTFCPISDRHVIDKSIPNEIQKVFGGLFQATSNINVRKTSPNQFAWSLADTVWREISERADYEWRGVTLNDQTNDIIVMTSAASRTETGKDNF